MNQLLHDWVTERPLMQQAVMIGGMRGADGTSKYNSTKFLLRFYRRCILRMALHGGIEMNDPIMRGGGSYMGPSVLLSDDEYYCYNPRAVSWEPLMAPILTEFFQTLDALPHHFVQHLRHGIEIVGYKHPMPHVREWWCRLYLRLCKDEHLLPEPESELDLRLSDNYEEWRKRSDDAISH
jgi:hypothetical protein